MADSARVSITKLNNENYQVWKYKLELLLIKEDLWEVVTGPEPAAADNAAWLKKDGKARATIGLLVEDSQLSHIRKAETAKQAWSALQKYHERATLTNKVHLLKRLCSMKIDDNGDMETHINAMLELVDRLTALGEELAEHLVVAFLLCSLPDSYATLITALESRAEEDLTLELVKGKLIHEYKRRLGTQETKPASETALKVEERKRTTQKKRPSCYHCKKVGHLKKDCWSLNPEKRPTKQKANKASDKSESQVENMGETQVCFQVHCGNAKDDWYVDSGATCHMSSNKSFFDKLDTEARGDIYLADGKSLKSEGIGEGKLKCLNDLNVPRLITVTNVRYVPNLEANLLSVTKLTSMGLEVNFTSNQCTISKNGLIVATADKQGLLYKLNLVQNANVATTGSSDCIHLWHRRMGHRDPAAIVKLEKEDLATGIHLKDCKIKETCDSCMKGKMARIPFPKESNSSSKEILDLIHTDICGPMQTVTPGGKKYILTLIDDKSRYTTVYLLAHKSEAAKRCREFVKAMETKFEKTPKVFRSDRGGEYMGNEFRDFLKEKGIEDQTTAPYSPQQNGVAERKNRSLTEMARCMLIDGRLANKYWGEAVQTATYLQNRLPTKGCDRTPYEEWYEKVPNLEHVKVFGCKTYMKIPDQHRRKLDDKAKLLTFVGYEKGAKAYRLLDVQTSRVYISRDVKFIEAEVDVSTDGEETSKECIPLSNVPQDSEDNVELIETTAENAEEDAMQREEQDEVQRRVSSRSTKGKPPERLIEAINLASHSEAEPSSFSEALKGKKKAEWKNAMDEEIQSLDKNNVWVLEELPEGKTTVGCKWVYKMKHNAKGDTVRYKARLVAQGYTQIFGEDYDEVYAPVAKQTTLRVLLAVAGKRQMTVRHYDVVTAFLNGVLNETVYMEQPEGYVEKGKEHLACRLTKSIYGLKQAARAWYKKMYETLIEEGFECSKADPCLFTKIVNGERIYLLLYVDDLIVASANVNLIDELGLSLQRSFEVTNLGNLSFYLGLQIERDESGIFLVNQETFIKKALERYGFENAKPSKIPMDPGYEKRNEVHEALNDNEKYRSAIGTLLYISVNSRPDISVSTSILSRKVSKPTEADWTEVKRVYRYLKNTQQAKLCLGETWNFKEGDLVGYADANWAENVEDRKSNSGFVFKLFGGAVSWRSRKQQCVTLSSTEAEYVALSEACQEGAWLKRLLNDFHETDSSTMTIFEDNQSCIKLVKTERVGSRSKHIDTRYHFIRDMMNNGEINLEYCPSEEMVADILTKPLEATKTRKFVSLLGIKM